ncbi:hypothetical protein [Salinibacter ruber]|uniref:hypothetical protein n=1 Tax=Salinibacter ruber TaxID=146919 RepID=UPI002169DCAA|nr:hypothetical protein [Salinibacter ruber]MCS3685797.1 hypothetical protein [Salinibacter ruber]
MSDNPEASNSEDGARMFPRVPLATLAAYFLFFFVSDLQGGSLAGASGYATGMSFIPGVLIWQNYKAGSSWAYWGSLVFMGLMFFGQYLKMSAA